MYTYCSENQKILDWVGFSGPVSSCALSRNGKYLAVLSGGKLYLHRIVKGFVYADMKHAPDPDSLNSRISIRASARADMNPGVDQSGLERMAREWISVYCTEQRKNSHSKDRLVPYAQILKSANPEKSCDHLLSAFMKELESRGLGYVSPEYALEILQE